MIDDDLYDLCRPILDDKDLDEEDKTDKLEDLLRKETSLTGAPLENVILDALWRHRESTRSGSNVRQPIVRRQSPAPWQTPRVASPLGSPQPISSPVPISSLTGNRPSFSSRQKSVVPSMPSPFSSPRPSPRLAFAQTIPHSPSLHAYEFSDTSPNDEEYGDYGSDTVEWLVADDAVSVASSTGTGSFSAVAPEWTPQLEMGPFDILRSVLGDKKTKAEIEEALEANSYDIAGTMAALSKDNQEAGQLKAQAAEFVPSVLVGKSILVNQPKPVNPATTSPIVCKYWLSSGSCARADCRFAHDLSNHVCKYWMNGNCLAGSGCAFSHDPALLMNALNVNDNSTVIGTPPPVSAFQATPENFPPLGQRSTSSSSLLSTDGQIPLFVPASQRNRVASRPLSRPTSRHQQRSDYSSNTAVTGSPLRPDTPQTAPSVDDQEAFPTLGSLSAKAGKKHHGKRGGHGHGNSHQTIPNSLADVVRMASPAPVQKKLDSTKRIRSIAQENAAAQKIPEPKHIPWLETGATANEQYLKYRAEAIKHGSIRNKFLQSAAQAWNRNDARAAKALSLRGQAENDAMRKAHREAARHLYEERNKHLSDAPDESENELYIDLHGLHPEEAIEYLESVLIPQSATGRKVIYAITGTGHHSKNGKDKVGKAVRGWLNEWQYVFREFSVPGERGGYVGGVLGIDPTSCAKQPTSSEENGSGKNSSTAPVVSGGKIQLLKREEVSG